MESIIAAVVGGLFSLITVLVGHYLRKKEARAKADPPPPPASAPPTVPPVATPTTDREPPRPVISTTPAPQFTSAPWRKMFIGIGLFIFNFLLLFVIPGSFALNTTEPWWENIFSFLVFGAIPIYAIYLFFAGLVGGIRQLFKW